MEEQEMFEGLFQPSHLILILLVTLLVFGPSKLPQIGAGLGKSIRDFKKAMSGLSDDSPEAPAAKRLPAAAAPDRSAGDSPEPKKS
jgi:sec-independent protein translocase protein TatA